MRLSLICKLIFAVALANLAGCDTDVVFGGSTPAPTPSGSPAPGPSGSPAPTVTGSPGPTVFPTSTAGIIPATPTPFATAVFTPSPTPTSINPFFPTGTNPAGNTNTTIISTAAVAPPSVPTPMPSATSVALSALADGDGKASLSFSVPLDSTKFAVSASAANDGYVKFDEAITESGVNYLNPQSLQLSLGGRQARYVNEINIPSRSLDPAIKTTDIFLITVRTYLDATGTAAAGQETAFTITSKADQDLNNGHLLVNVFYVGGSAASEASKSAVRQALQHFSDLYAAAGIVLQIAEKELAGPELLPNPVDGDPFYATASSQVAMPALNLFIGTDIARGSNEVLLGLSPGIPGPPIASPRSALAVALLAGAGPSGVYDAEKTRILGETIAHESGHYLGLFHPVEIVNQEVVSTDPLDDTPTCSAAEECLANSDLISNLMFPVVVYSDGKTVPQSNLTAEQRGVLNRYIAVD